ncbi:tRNA (adenosine(37)-N6)-threonylcarbamoyltransferase complex ATPase subunit type 1 TsaE [Planktothrix sp. FACHB-1365]|uniref:tRNA (adenosine(37)-N6)-threonylcarbamoyltransferase complex ATPase subunit type 1 TsaE n=1 Tax=Planktothrix sp. FACHB-1365 TaxID=2692855 RepID=UPI00168968C9|nr:tRNA (adenosine(37)-N6)-threonylcarbamoyltransferase complex ATPase subunit type 1 TsaE [Planktothrix sp. FACHB-1365]MBD2482354.1 tRNA (adenosine(37)-N6)-threonylcarbamoyltransferase complex ATPase subunit type 1 TsaE [Planktothrix sp. FACHB-1365]
MTQFYLPNAEATRELGKNLGRSLPANSVLLLQGNLGAGKTTFVQGLAAGLDISESIESPTFTLINEYTTGRIPLYHLDLYRLDPSEIEDLNLEQYWEGIEVEPGIVAIEWADRLPYKPESYLQIELTYTETGDRIATLLNVGQDNVNWGSKLGTN